MFELLVLAGLVVGDHGSTPIDSATAQRPFCPIKKGMTADEVEKALGDQGGTVFGKVAWYGVVYNKARFLVFYDGRTNRVTSYQRMRESK